MSGLRCGRVSFAEKALHSVLGAIVVGFSVFGILLLLFEVLTTVPVVGHPQWPPPWFWGVLGGASAIAALFGAVLGASDPLWGPTFHSREHGYDGD